MLVEEAKVHISVANGCHSEHLRVWRDTGKRGCPKPEIARVYKELIGRDVPPGKRYAMPGTGQLVVE